MGWAGGPSPGSPLQATRPANPVQRIKFITKDVGSSAKILFFIFIFIAKQFFFFSGKGKDILLLNQWNPYRESERLGYKNLLTRNQRYDQHEL